MVASYVLPRRLYMNMYSMFRCVYFLFKHTHVPILWCVVLFCICACGRGEHVLIAEPLQHASLLRMSDSDGVCIVEVLDPWNENKLMERYLLVDTTRCMPDQTMEGTIVYVPLQRVVVTSSPHAVLMVDLQAHDAIAMMFDTAYVFNATLKENIRNGIIADGGSAMRPALEKISAVHPDAIWATPFENSGYGGLQQLGTPVISCVDYMEETPLGRAEWMRFYGRLVGKGAQADSLFAVVQKEYDALCSVTEQATRQPTVLCDMMQGGTWLMPGGKSYVAQMLADAGTRYLFAQHAEKGSVAMSFEYVFAQARNADVWLIKSASPAHFGYADITKEHSAYQEFDAWKKKSVYHCNTLSVPYFEETVFRPERLLRNLVNVFHPHLLQDSCYRYYRPLR